MSIVKLNNKVFDSSKIIEAASGIKDIDNRILNLKEIRREVEIFNYWDEYSHYIPLDGSDIELLLEQGEKELNEDKPAFIKEIQIEIDRLNKILERLTINLGRITDAFNIDGAYYWDNFFEEEEEYKKYINLLGNFFSKIDFVLIDTITVLGKKGSITEILKKLHQELTNYRNFKKDTGFHDVLRCLSCYEGRSEKQIIADFQ